jgi:hypothetical protein
MSDSQGGTSIEDIEMGAVKHEADSDRMKEILADMNVMEEPVHHAPSAPQTREYQQPPHYIREQQPQYRELPPPMDPRMSLDEYYEYEEQQKPRYRPVRKQEPVASSRRKNGWESAIELIKDPLIVGILVLLLSLPALHTFVGKHATWAYGIGGELSWPGLIVLSVFAAVVFGTYRSAMAWLGM